MRRKSSPPGKKVAKESFSERCYTLLSKVPAGSVTTYGELARALKTRAFRAVGQAMNKNPHAPKVPCHRVVCSDGKLGGYAFGTKKKIAMLSQEGVRVVNGRIENFEASLFRF